MIKRGVGIVLLLAAAVSLSVAAISGSTTGNKASGHPPCGPSCNGECPYPALDTDKDGMLSAAEIAAAKADRALSCVKCHDTKRFSKSVSKADADRNGALSPAERATLCRQYAGDHKKKKGR